MPTVTFLTCHGDDSNQEGRRGRAGGKRRTQIRPVGVRGRHAADDQDHRRHGKVAHEWSVFIVYDSKSLGEKFRVIKDGKFTREK